LETSVASSRYSLVLVVIVGWKVKIEQRRRARPGASAYPSFGE
jgi:hypothetical protein